MSEEFEKELPSDVDDATALPLLDEQADTNELWKDFSESDLPLMLEAFSILKMKAGERLIATGEYASFCGIILQGTFTAHVTPTLKVDLKPGDTIGEMALFEGGERNADVYTGNDPEGCILAMIRYNDLETLEAMERYQTLARKLKNLFAVASISKLRNMINSKPAGAAPAAAQAHAPESIFTAKIPGGPKAVDAPKTARGGASAAAAASSSAPAAAAPSEAATKLLAEMQTKLNARDATIAELQAQIAKLTTAAAAAAAAPAPAPAAAAPAATTSPAAAATPVKKPAAAAASAVKSPTAAKAAPAAAAKKTITSPTAAKTAAAGAKPVVKKVAAAKPTSSI